MKDLKFWIVVVLIVVNLLLIGVSIGMRIGFDQSNKLHDRAECVVNYSYKPYLEIPARCLKYFDIKGE